MSLCPVILAGGDGTRLWPLSRSHYPKQFLRLFGGRSMLQDTLIRLDGLDSVISQLDPILVCNEAHRFLVLEQAEEIHKTLQMIILEAEGRNTAPALTVVAEALMDQPDDVVMLMMPADHVIADTPRFQDAVKAGYQMAQQGSLVTFGIQPQSAETGYGYIHCGKILDKQSGIRKIAGFKEKPNAKLALEYLNSDNYLWNSGIFMIKISVWLREINKFQPDIYLASQDAYRKGQVDNAFYRLDKDAFLACKSDSVDYAVMEKLSDKPDVLTAVVPLDAGWSDIGAWSAVWELGEQDDAGNVIAGDVILQETSNSLLKSEHRLIATLGCDNLIVVETADVVLVSSKDKAQEIKSIIAVLEAKGRTERLTHRRVFRPWGSYETVDIGERFQVKRVSVNPGKRLSLQLHHQRSEHWVVVKGTATVTKDKTTFLLAENESTYIPTGSKHRLENATDQTIEIIEVQSGDYLGEDDIERFDDDFGREGSSQP